MGHKLEGEYYESAMALRALQLARGLTQHDIHRILGVATSKVGEWERGESEPEQLMLIRLLSQFGLDLDDWETARVCAGTLIETLREDE